MNDAELIDLQHQVEHHEGELNQLLKRIQELQEDLEVVAAFANPMTIGQIRHYTTGVPSATPTLKAKALRFLQRNGSVEVP